MNLNRPFKPSAEAFRPMDHHAGNNKRYDTKRLHPVPDPLDRRMKKDLSFGQVKRFFSSCQDSQAAVDNWEPKRSYNEKNYNGVQSRYSIGADNIIEFLGDVSVYEAGFLNVQKSRKASPL